MACVLEPIVINELKKKHPELHALNLPAGEKYKSLGHGIGIKKENTKLTQHVTSIIKTLKQDKTLKKLTKKWFGEEKTGENND